ncbi:unnamed protein product [Peronospora destructor]|uniref:Alpha-type protein kinase domain-containing protein n=1 Tax=Peronospora destructor TaxID=86335 RepID=A0AAV0UDY8_9STRA|nr:unnamed protein product [Peronospora destructor]
MALLSAIEEDAKMQSKLCSVILSPLSSGGSLQGSPSLSTCSVIPGIKKPKTPDTAMTLNPSISWGSFRKTQKEDTANLIPIRRRFYSSDIILRSKSRVWTKWNHVLEHGQVTGLKNPNGLNDSCTDEKEEFELEPLMDHFSFRRRTCSENFTKSSRVPSSFFQKINLFYQVDLERFYHREQWRENQVVKEREHKMEEDVGYQLMVEIQEDCEEEEIMAKVPAVDGLLDGSWSSQSLRIQHNEIEVGSASGSNHSVESDGKNLEKLRNLQKLYQEGFITVTEYKDRRVQLVDELSEADQTIAKTSDLLSLELPIVYREPPDFLLMRERSAIKHVFDSEHRTWTSSRIKVKIDAVPFANGGLRQVFHLQDLSMPPPALRVDDVYEDSVMSKCTSYVAKIAIDPNENPDTYFKDVEMQAVAAKYAKLYNSYNPPRRVEFLEACILQLIPTGASDAGDQVIENLTLSGTICGVEPFIAGEYHKHNNNYGYVSELERNTPQAFSHFTYEASGQQIIVVDIQGVGDHYTDPQIHSRRGKEFGKGNLALRGFERFLGSHRCNPICRYLKLPLINPKDEEDRKVDLKGTIPAQTYMSQPRVTIDQVDSVLCHYYGDSKAFKRYAAKKKREKKKRGKHHQKSHSKRGHEEKWQAQEFGIEAAGDCGDGGSIEHAVGAQQAGNRFAAALVDHHRSCSSFVCDGVSQCIVS